MDEPTNDLDIETLEILEELLLEYDGTLLLVSHDRAFLNNIVTSTIALDGNGKVTETVGGYDEWKRQADQPDKIASDSLKPASAPSTGSAPTVSTASRKLTYREQRALEAQQLELAELPHRIESLEADVYALTTAMADASFYQQDNAEITSAVDKLNQIHNELAQAYRRWEELDKL
jgi:ATP-binding cassette subfamily F protein uup